MQRLVFGNIHADYIGFDEAIRVITDKALKRSGGYIVTPNVDHVVVAENDKRLTDAYRNAALSLCDGKPLLWISHMIRLPLPEKISGSDLVKPLLYSSATKGLKVYLLGAAPGVGEAAAENLKREIPNLIICGTDSPPIGFDKDYVAEQLVLDKMLAADPDIVLVALGAPKQEILMHRWYNEGVEQVMLGIGASLDFIAGRVPRAPKWVSEIGFEWIFRMCQDPKRLIKRYLVRDLRIIKIFIAMLLTPKEKLVVSTRD